MDELKPGTWLKEVTFGRGFFNEVVINKITDVVDQEVDYPEKTTVRTYLTEKIRYVVAEGFTDLVNFSLAVGLVSNGKDKFTVIEDKEEIEGLEVVFKKKKEEMERSSNNMLSAIEKSYKMALKDQSE